jgi:SNF2 family DNA or RNA helicase
VLASQKVKPDGPILLLSGTPVPNRAAELESQLLIAQRLDDFGGPAAFRKLSRNPLALNRRLRSTCFLRRLKADVLPDLPPKRVYPLMVTGSTKEMAEYRKAEKDVVAYLAARARQFALEAGEDPKAADSAAWQAKMRAASNEQLVALGVLRRLAAKAKLAEADEWVESFLESGKKLVVFGINREIVGHMAAKHAGGRRIQGDVNDKQRAAAVDAFQQDPDARVISCSIAAAGVGITLTAASDVLFTQQGWTPADIDQPVDRCHRIGQRDSVTGVVLICEDTIEADIYELVERKRGHVNAVVDGVAADASQSVVADLVVRLAEKGLNT